MQHYGKHIIYRKNIEMRSENVSLKSKMILFTLLTFIQILFLVVSIIFFILEKVLYKSGYEIYYIALGIVVEAIFMIYHISKFNKKRKELIDFETTDYITKFPSEHKPAIVSYLMQGENNDGSDITATLLDLVQRKYISMEEEYRLEDLLKNTKNVLLKINFDSKKAKELSAYENYLVNWFFTEYGDGSEIRTSDLRERLKNDSHSGSKFTEWQRLVKEEYDSNNFIEEKKVNNLIHLLLFFCLSLNIFLIFIVSDGNIKLPILFEIILFFLSQCVIIKFVFDGVNNERILTSYGRSVTRKWNGFINYIKTHSIIDEYNILGIALYEKYLVYSVALNIADKTIKDMQKNYGWELYKYKNY